MSDSSNNTTDSSNNVTDSSNNVTDSSNNVTDSSCNCYQLFVLDASGGFTIQQNLQDVSLNEQMPLALYDISSAIQIRLGVRSLNSALGIEKDDANRNVVQTTYDASSEMFSPNDLSYNTTTLLESIVADPDYIQTGGELGSFKNLIQCSPVVIFFSFFRFL